MYRSYFLDRALGLIQCDACRLKDCWVRKSLFLRDCSLGCPCHIETDCPKLWECRAFIPKEDR
jgi:hypothetical protein